MFQNVKNVLIFTNVPIIGFKMIGVLKITLLGLCYLKMMRRADPDCVRGRNALVRYVNQ